MNADSDDLAACMHCLCFASRQAARAITSVYDRRMRPHGIRATQFTILTNLMLRGAIALGALAKALGMERTTLTRNLALLEGRGLVAIRPGETDSRARVIAVTEAGRALVHDAFPDWRKAQQQASAAFGQAGVAALHKLAGTALQ
jgi:DNA-binding MarR family transcriptional regulator